MTPTPTGKALLDTFGQIIIINLRHRRDRRRDIAHELKTLGLGLGHERVHLLRAIRPEESAGFPTIGAHGAFLSHRAACALIIKRQWPQALVLEDDMALLPDALPRLDSLVRTLKDRPWDIVYGHPGTESTLIPDADGMAMLPPAIDMIQLHFLGLSQRAAQRIVPTLGAMMTRPEGSPLGGPMHVDGALNWVRRANPDLVTLAANPAIARQRPSRSDIAELRWFDRTPGISQLAEFARRLRR